MIIIVRRKCFFDRGVAVGRRRVLLVYFLYWFGLGLACVCVCDVGVVRAAHDIIPLLFVVSKKKQFFFTIDSWPPTAPLEPPLDPPWLVPLPLEEPQVVQPKKRMPPHYS